MINVKVFEWQREQRRNEDHTMAITPAKNCRLGFI